MSELIPEARRGSVREALRAAFGDSPPSDMRPIGGGVSGALILAFQVRERPYVLRLEPGRIAPSHRERGYACMTAAAAAGAAPAVRFADPAAGVTIIDFIAARPLSTHPGGVPGLVTALGGLVASLQATPPFPSLGDYPDLIGDLLIGLEGSPLLAPGELAPHAEALATIRSALRWDPAALVSSHNDPNPRNILYDGERLWLVDWELAFRNDPLVDPAILTTEFAESRDLDDLLIEAALRVPPDDYLRARLAVIRLLTRLFYGGIVLDGLAGAGPGLPPTQLSLTPTGFRAAVADGRLASGAPATAYAFARMSLRAFLDGVSTRGFRDALEIVRQG